MKMPLHLACSLVLRSWPATRMVGAQTRPCLVSDTTFGKLTELQGNILYSKSFGKTSLKACKDQEPFNGSTICAVASLSKLMTTVAVLQAVEQGKLDLDSDVRSTFPLVGQYGIMTGFDDEERWDFRARFDPHHPSDAPLPHLRP